MGKLIKIVVIFLAMFPMWVTLVALSAPETPSDEWKNYLNGQLLKLKSPRIQVTEMLPTMELPDASYKKRSPEFDLSHLNPRGVTRLGLRYRDEKGRLDRMVYLPVRAYVQRQVPVATRPIRSGEFVQEGDFDLRWMDATQVGSAPASRQQLTRGQARSFIAAEAVIQSSHIQPPQMVQRGDRVKVQAVRNGLIVSTIGIAQEAGSLGQTIRIMNMDSRREMFATVTGDQVAEVQL